MFKSTSVVSRPTLIIPDTRWVALTYQSQFALNGTLDLNRKLVAGSCIGDPCVLWHPMAVETQPVFHI